MGWASSAAQRLWLGSRPAACVRFNTRGRPAAAAQHVSIAALPCHPPPNARPSLACQTHTCSRATQGCSRRAALEAAPTLAPQATLPSAAAAAAAATRKCMAGGRQPAAAVAAGLTRRPRRRPTPFSPCRCSSRGPPRWMCLAPCRRLEGPRRRHSFVASTTCEGGKPNKAPVAAASCFGCGHPFCVLRVCGFQSQPFAAEHPAPAVSAGWPLTCSPLPPIRAAAAPRRSCAAASTTPSAWSTC